MQKTPYNKKLKEFARDLRNDSTLGEIILWKRVLRARNFYGYQFNRQFPIGNYIVDFICRKLKLVIEIDGYSHKYTQKRDEEKDNYLESVGFTFMRFKESEIKYDLDNVVRKLEDFIEK